MALAELSLFELTAFLQRESEWLIAKSDGPSFSARSNEIEFRATGLEISVAFPFDKGRETWRVADWSFNEPQLHLEVFSEADGVIDVLRIVPRTRSAELKSEIEAVRLQRALAIARAYTELRGRSRIVRAELGRENGRFANIIAEAPSGRLTAIIADVSDSLTPEFLLGAAVVWIEKLRRRKRKPVERVAIVAPNHRARGVQRLRALLKDEWQHRIDVFEFKTEDEAVTGDIMLSELVALERESLWTVKARNVDARIDHGLSPLAELLQSSAPSAVDVVRSRQGETVRYHGLPFARTRFVGGVMRVWFGVSNRAVVSEGDFRPVEALMEEISERRTHDASQRRHEYFRIAPEAWLESMLRRNIKLLDPNLIVSPIHHQFRAERDKIDLLALRSDGRLVIIEVKVSTDREMVFQAVDYWRKIEAERRCGNLAAMKLFGDMEISDRPAIVYLVAPTLAYHADMDLLVSTLAPDIPICRFDLFENWRREVKVFRRREPGRRF